MRPRLWALVAIALFVASLGVTSPAHAQQEAGAPQRITAADFAITPPPGWSTVAAADRVLLFPAGSRPLAGSQTAAPFLYLRVVRDPTLTVEAAVSRTGLRLFGRDPRRDEAPVMVRIAGEQLLTGQFFGGANDAVAYRAFVGAVTLPRQPDALLLVLAWAPEQEWEQTAGRMNRALHTLVLGGGGAP